MKRDWALIGLGVASAVGYAAAAWAAGAVGFPLDDAWIHQTYARNLGWHGQWAFILGQPSAGSTSPLWTMLLALGYALRIDYAWWTLGLNSVLLGVTAWLVGRVGNSFYLGALAAIEWHLVWAAASGMETALFCALTLGAWLAAVAGATRSHALAGMLIGLAVWTRPDGLTLLPFVALVIWVRGGRLRQLASFVVGAAVVVIPYFLFNFALSGQVWPNTFFAKQAEYAILRELPLWQRLLSIFSAPFVGTLALLWPGLFTKDRQRLLMLGWATTFLVAYALRLPVTYQHGRYLIPVIPILIVVGGGGAGDWVQVTTSTLWRRVVSRAWVLTVGVVAIAFWLIGLRALIADNRIINSEMAATAKWVASNISPGTLIAAHDIGALGYFADVQLVDLAGLVSPEVIPYVGNDSRLWAFVQSSGAKYFINYPGWCPAFISDEKLKLVFQTGPLCEVGIPHMAVFALEIR
ncbi:MAG: hypothetical protein HYZ49_20990 [Chloroflexi bacterium]|nr:hypothetical protein [Chloroflexota bacterium]